MGRGDNKRTAKTKQRREQKKKKLRLQRRIEAGKKKK